MLVVLLSYVLHSKECASSAVLVKKRCKFTIYLLPNQTFYTNNYILQEKHAFLLTFYCKMGTFCLHYSKLRPFSPFVTDIMPANSHTLKKSHLIENKCCNIATFFQQKCRTCFTANL